MAVNSIATMAIRIVVTTWPFPGPLSPPNTHIGATGWITITPYRIRSQSVSERLRRGALAGGLAVELIHVLKVKPHYPDLAEITGYGETLVDTQNSSRILYGRDILSMKKHLY